MTEMTKTAPPVETVLAEIRDCYEAATPGPWCPLSEPCHADVLLGIANSEPGSGS